MGTDEGAPGIQASVKEGWSLSSSHSYVLLMLLMLLMCRLQATQARCFPSFRQKDPLEEIVNENRKLILPGEKAVPFQSSRFSHELALFQLNNNNHFCQSATRHAARDTEGA